MECPIIQLPTCDIAQWLVILSDLSSEMRYWGNTEVLCKKNHKNNCSQKTQHTGLEWCESEIITTIKLGELSLNISKPKLYPASWIDRKHSSTGKRDQITFSEVFITEVVTFSSFKMGKKNRSGHEKKLPGRRHSFSVRHVGFLWLADGISLPRCHQAITSLSLGNYLPRAALCLCPPLPASHMTSYSRSGPAAAQGEWQDDWRDIYRETRNGVSWMRGPRLLRSLAL